MEPIKMEISSQIQLIHQGRERKIDNGRKYNSNRKIASSFSTEIKKNKSDKKWNGKSK